MGREGVDKLKTQYRDLYGRRPCGSQANNPVWLQGRINDKLKDRVGPRGPRGPRGAIGKTGHKGAKGDKGDDGEDGEDGLSFLFVKKEPVEEQKRERNSTKRIEQQIINSQSAPQIQRKYKEVLGLLEQSKKMQYSMSGLGKKISFAAEDFHVKKSEAEEVHEEIKSLTVGNELALEYISIQLALDKPSLPSRLKLQYFEKQVELKLDPEYVAVESLLAERMALRKRLKQAAVEAQDKLKKLRTEKQKMQAGHRRLNYRAEELEREADAEMNEMTDCQDFCGTQDFDDTMPDSQESYDDSQVFEEVSVSSHVSSLSSGRESSLSSRRASSLSSGRASTAPFGAGVGDTASGTASGSSFSLSSSWVYIDVSGQPQGPFPTEQMQSWWESQQLPSTTKVRPNGDGHEYIQLGEIFKNEGNRPTSAAVPARGRGRPRRALRANHEANQSDVDAMFGGKCFPLLCLLNSC
eukprot:SAG11_NODE_69_length_18453_cov_37.601613_2_plen_466_part_00